MGASFRRFRQRLSAVLNLSAQSRSAIEDWHAASLQNMRDGLIAFDRDNHITLCNSAAVRSCGTTTSWVGRSLDELLRACPELAELDWTAVEARHEVTLNGLPHEAQMAPLIDHHDQLLGKLLVLRDIAPYRRLEEQLQGQKQLLETLVAVAHATNEQLALEPTLHNVLEVGVALTAAEHGSLFLMDGFGAIVEAVGVGNDAAPDEQRQLIRRIREQGVLGWVITNRQAALINDTRLDARWLPLPGEATPIRSVLALPIIHGALLLGVLVLFHSQPNQFKLEQLQLIQAAADHMALALQHARSYDMQRRMTDRQAALYQVLHAVGGQLDPGAVARVAVDEITRLTGWQNVMMVLLQENQQTLEVRAAGGALTHTVGLMLSTEQGVIRRAFATGRTQCVPDVSLVPDYIQVDATTRSELAVPLRRSGRIRGVLNIESRQLAAFDTYDISLVESLADAIGLALDNAQLYRAISEEHSRLQAMIDTSRDGIALVGLNQQILVCNRPVLDFLKLSGEPKDWMGQAAHLALNDLRRAAPQAAHAMLTEIRKRQASAETFAEGEIEVPPHTLHWMNLPVASGTNQLGYLIVLRDVTAEREITRTRDDLTRMLVHDLRNPLGVILTSYTLLEMDPEKPLAPRQSEVVELGQHAAERMMDLVNAILDVSRLESGQMRLACEPVELPTLVDNILSLQTMLARERQLQLLNELASDLPRVFADSALIGRVIQNLVGNAIKFTPPSGTIRVTAQPPVPGEKLLSLAVSDTGPGIPPELQSRLFQKFVTGQQAGHGTGLGLAFCKLVVEAHGGTIAVSSQPKQGTTFTFTLPLA